MNSRDDPTTVRAICELKIWPTVETIREGGNDITVTASEKGKIHLAEAHGMAKTGVCVSDGVPATDATTSLRHGPDLRGEADDA